MIFKKLFFLFYLSISFKLFPFQLSQNSHVSVITIGSSQKELYSAFGHSGIRIKDDSLGVDYFYNYGVFDFNQPNFYLNFLKGKLLYMVVKYNFISVKDHYILNHRDIKEQILNLDLYQKKKIFKFLEKNILDENKYYYYNYLYNNCATKIRDVFDEIIPEYVQYDYDYLSDNLSFRELMDIYLNHQQWGDLGIDICLGSQIDIEADGYNAMYLPDYLFMNFNHANTNRQEKLVLKENQIFSSQVKSNFYLWISPSQAFLFLLILSILIFIRERKYNLWYWQFDFFLLVLSGGIGILLIYLWFFTDHLSAYNYNLIWAFPLNIIVALFFINNRMLKKIKLYFLFYSFLLICLIFLWYFLPQQLNDALIIFVILLLSRSSLIFFQLNKSLNN